MPSATLSPIAKTPVNAEQEPHLRLYRRLWLSRIDLEEAKASIDEILTRNLPYPRRKAPSPILQALTTALVVAYARPFVNSVGNHWRRKGPFLGHSFVSYPRASVPSTMNSSTSGTAKWLIPTQTFSKSQSSSFLMEMGEYAK